MVDAVAADVKLAWRGGEPTSEMIAFLHKHFRSAGHLPPMERRPTSLLLSPVSNAAGHASTSQPPALSLSREMAGGLKGIFR
jgi:hypothetical protein